MKKYQVLLLVIALVACSEKNNTNNFIESRPIKTTFSNLIDTIKERSEKNVCLNPPATSEEIAEAEDSVGQPFPEEVKIVYKLANGQKDEPNCVPIFPEGYSFLPLKYLVKQWELMRELSDGDPDFTTLYDTQGAVQGYGWTPKWIPIGKNILDTKMDSNREKYCG